MSEFAIRANLQGSLGEGDSPKFIHIAGTNGKGSVTAMIQSCLVEQGYRTGAFFSPYVVNPRERIQVGREMITEDELATLTTDLMPIGESLCDTEFGGVTEFEFKTAMGFEYWKQKQCEWVALEVGLGGRLDATNIVSPAASAIVSISYDHVSILGSTLAEIAREKAGIIKPGCPVVVGEMPDEAFEVIEQVAIENQSLLWKVGREVLWSRSSSGVRIETPYSTINLSPNLFGEIQLHNTAVAFSALELARAIKDRHKLSVGISTAYLPGRFQRIEYRGKQFILDGAHNADSALVLANLLREAKIHPHLCISGMLTGHSPDDFYGALKGLVDEYIIAPIDFHRSMNPTDLAKCLGNMGLHSTVSQTVKEAIDSACENENAHEILVCGSFYLVGEVMRLLQSQS
jgi:dihydrofolate synthase/folylpolyglutamate synthase